METLTHDQYTIGWICALRDELTAAMAMLDQPHGQLHQPDEDKNSYALGRIGKHNVVLAGLPSGKTGRASAALVTKDLKRTFSAVRYVLMVGIAGGVPTATNDIRLGDIVVSVPGPKNSGVVQYDFGKTIDDGIFKQTGALDSAPSGLLAAVASVRARHRLSKYGYIENIQDLPEGLDPEFARPSEDLQFRADYDHKTPGALDCRDCDPTKLNQLNPRRSPVPRVFYGTIASADRVMRHGLTRDRIAEQCGALCFEMEVAGLANDFPCLVIRGICDYADTHKTKEWQGFAAIAASAYAKELLGQIAPKDVVEQIPLSVAREKDSKTADMNQASITTRSSSGGGTAFDFYSHLNKKVLESDTVALGRIVKNKTMPWDDYDASATRVSDDRIGISVQDRFENIIQTHESGVQVEQLRRHFASLLQMPNSEETLQSAAEKTYVLRNPAAWLKSACAKKSTRDWLDGLIPYNPTAFMVVGIHTASNYPASTNEVIVAVRYRRVDLNNWISSQDVDSIRLANEPSIFKPSIIARDDSPNGQLIHIVLQDSTEAEQNLDMQVMLDDLQTEHQN